MKKLWFGLFAFVLSVCCGFAIVYGSYTKANLIAHSNAYMSYDVNDSDDSPYWEEYTMPTFHSYDFLVGADGVMYSFYTIYNDTDPEDSYYEMYVDIYDGNSVTNHIVNAFNLYLDESDGELENILDFTNVFLGDGVIYIGVVGDNSYYVYNIADYSFEGANLDNRVYYFTNDSVFYYTTSGVDHLYHDGTEILVDNYDFDESYMFSFVCGDYFYCSGYDLLNDSSVSFKFSSDGTYVILDTNVNNITEFNYWSDGKYAYYDNGSTHMIFDSATNTWASHVWTGYTGSFDRQNVWSDGENVYMTLSNGTTYRMHIDRPYVSPYPNVLAEMIALMTSGIAGIAEGIGANLSVLAESVMIDVNTGNLSAFGSLVVIMAGLALALHLCRWIVGFVTSLGKRNR